LVIESRPTPVVSRPARRRAVPYGARLGALAIAFGVLLDIVEHGLATGARSAGPGFAPGEHLAHLAVVVGMVLVLVGIVVDGTRGSGRSSPPEWRSRDAVR
jgi:hypothetical protein